jgi:hypothetical protein
MVYCRRVKSELKLLLGGSVTTFMRLKTDSAGRVYLYEENRWREGKTVKSKSRSHGRVHGFWFMLAILVDNLGDVFRTKTHGYNAEEAELQAAEKSEAERERDRQKEWEITHPGWAARGVPEVTPPSSEDQPALRPEEPKSAFPSDVPEGPAAPDAAPNPE